MDVASSINTNCSVLGSELLEWIRSDRQTKTEEQQLISYRLYHKYVVDRNGQPKNKIYPDVYYYVNYNNRFNHNVYMAYIVRDKARSPRNIPPSLASLDLTSTNMSYRGSLIQEWAHYHRGHDSSPYHDKGSEIVERYFMNSHPIRTDAYYYLAVTSKGIRLFRDTDKSPRPEHR